MPPDKTPPDEMPPENTPPADAARDDGPRPREAGPDPVAAGEAPAEPTPAGAPEPEPSAEGSAVRSSGRRRRLARGLQLAGLIAAIAGLIGYWSFRDVERAALTAEQRQLIGVEGEEPFRASFLVAGRDLLYEEGKSEPIYGEGGAIVGWEYTGRRTAYGRNTDTILFVQIVGNEATLIAIPRDIWLPQHGRRINTVYGYSGAEGLSRTVEEIVGLPVDYYAVVNLHIFERLVDALGGVEVHVPYRMYYEDRAGGLFIDLQPGLQRLDGEQASDFVRYRQTLRGDIDRLDRVKGLAYAMLREARDPSTVLKLPGLADAVLSNVETNAQPALVRKLLPRLASLQIGGSATLPTREVELESGDLVLAYDPAEVESFLASTFGGQAREFATPPETTLLITNRSGVEGLERWYRERLVAMGVPEERVIVREAAYDPSPTRMFATGPHWLDADFYADLLRVSKQQVDRLSSVERRAVGLELVLGEDAARAVALRRPALTAAATPPEE